MNSVRRLDRVNLRIEFAAEPVNDTENGRAEERSEDSGDCRSRR